MTETQTTGAEFTTTSCDRQDFNNVPRSRWDCVKEEVRKEYGIIVTNDKGRDGKDGFVFAWEYNESAKTLWVQCVDSPWWAPCSTINGKIQDLAKKCP